MKIYRGHTDGTESQNKDIELILTGDWQVGSTTGLHPNVKKINGTWTQLEQTDGWGYKHNPRYQLNSTQKRIWGHYENCLSEMARRREGKSMFILEMGDIKDGVHHNTPQVTSAQENEHNDACIQLMKYTKERLNYASGDTLAMLQGTYVHVKDDEDYIGREVGAEEYDVGIYAAPFLEINLNGVLIWAYHKGVSAGQGHLRGNAQINKMKQIYYQYKSLGEKVPTLIITAHTHDYNHAAWVNPDGVTMHYIITPPFQDKTRFAQDNLATNKNRVGMTSVTITESGYIIINEPLLLASPLGYSYTR